MRFANKVPPSDRDLSEALLSDGWRRIREPQNLFLAIVFSIPIMILNTVVIFCLLPPFRYWILELGEMMISTGIIITIDYKIITFVSTIFVYLIVHELLHAMLIPNFLKSQKTYLGIAFYGGFVSTTEEISKRRFILISVVPLIVLSIIVPHFFILLGLFNGFIAFLAIMNAMASSVDIFNVFLVGVQVPNGCRIINNGNETYFKY